MSDLRLALRDLPRPDVASGEEVRARAARTLRPGGALARLDELAVWLAEWQRTPRPRVDRPAAVVFAADHGVATEGVSAYPASVTSAMLEALDKGVATASVLAATQGIPLLTVDVGVGRPTSNMVFAPALGHQRFAQAFETGANALRGQDCDLLILGEMGIANTTAAAAVSYALFGGSPRDWVGPGTGLDETGVRSKVSVVERAVARVGAVEPFEVIAQLGGAEMAAMAGAAVEARRRSIPVLLDGYVATAALMFLEVDTVGALDHCWPGHVSPEPGHSLLLDRLGKRPILDLEMRLGEGSGALAAVSLVRLAAASVVDVATFEEWGMA